MFNFLTGFNPRLYLGIVLIVAAEFMRLRASSKLARTIVCGEASVSMELKEFDLEIVGRMVAFFDFEST